MKATSVRQAAVVAMIGLAGCAGSEAKRASAPVSPEPATAAPAADMRPGAKTEGQAEKSAAPPPPQPTTPPPAAEPSGGTSSTSNRSVAMSQASRDVESAQRELDVAGGDCRNACRALGSMDRAAGRLCGLAESPDEQRRCGDAKSRVYSARDKVRNTCGSCPEVSVDRNAPIPSH